MFLPTPSPSAYMRPSFQMAPGRPWRAAYSSSVTASSALPSRSARVPDCSAWLPERSPWVGPGAGGVSRSKSRVVGLASGTARLRSRVAEFAGGTAAAGASGTPSKLDAGGRPSARPIRPRLMTLNVRIARFLGRPAGMGHGAVARGPDLLGVFPQISGGEFGTSRLPGFCPRIELCFRQLDVEDAFIGIEHDEVTIVQQPDRTADRGLRPDMAYAESARSAGKASVGDQRDLAAHALAVERCGGRQHFAHSGAALRPFVANDEHVAFLVLLLLHRLEARFLPVKAARRAGEFRIRHPGNLHNGAFRREVALEPDDAAGGGERLVGGTDHVLVLVPLHAFQVLGQATPRNRQALPVQEAMVEQRLQQQRNAASFEQIFGNITAARLQIGDIGCPFEDLRHIEKIECEAAFVSDGGQMQRRIG